MTETPSKPQEKKDLIEKELEEAIEPSLFRLTAGLPRKELKMMVREALDCETALEGEIALLEKSLQNESDLSEKEKAEIRTMMTSEVTPPDHYLTVSALLGRLREPFTTPLPPNATALSIRRRQQQQQQQLQPQNKKKKHSTTPTNSSNSAPTLDDGRSRKRLLERQNLLLALEKYPEYREPQEDTAPLLTLWKRISTHRKAAVFRKPVNPKEAPDYTDRIHFPIDLSLIRKMITAKIITSFAELHQRIGLVCHNCVKFNGRESDYGGVTRDFEAHVDDCMVQTITALSHKVSSSQNKG